MDNILTPRQAELLNAIIQEFMDTAEAVGSIHLPEKYELGVSPATIRNEMMELVRKGYLAKPHASSGRIPTSQAFKFFVNEILDKLNAMEVATDVRVREKIFQERFAIDKLFYEAVKNLSQLTQNASIAIYLDRIYHYGVSEMLDLPEYQEPNRLKKLLSVLEDYKLLIDIFQRHSADNDMVKILIGEEIALDAFEKAAIVFAKINFRDNTQAYISVIGPNRMNYASVIPKVKWMGQVINEYIVKW